MVLLAVLLKSKDPVRATWMVFLFVEVQFVLEEFEVTVEAVAEVVVDVVASVSELGVAED